SSTRFAARITLRLVAKSSSLNGRRPPMPIGRLLVCISHLESYRFMIRRGDDLQADGEAFLRESAQQGQCGRTEMVERRSIARRPTVSFVHRFSDQRRGLTHRRQHEDVDLLEDLLDIAPALANAP